MKVFTSIEQIEECYTPKALKRKKIADMTPFEYGEHLAQEQMERIKRRLKRWPREVLEVL